jgi:ubiquinone/menaquinone biosynthesis C-methylase UbiE
LLGNAEKLVLKDSSVDAIISAELLEHIFNPTAVLEEYSRVLKLGSLLILSLQTAHFANN